MTADANADEGTRPARRGPDSDLTLRPATAEDAAALAGVDTATSMQPWSEAMFITELARGDRRYVVGERLSTRTLVGYAGIALLAGDAHVLGLAVLPSQQGRGYGRALLSAISLEAARADATAMTLEVRPSNAVARHLYRQMGFASSGRRPRYYPDGEDALILWRGTDAGSAGKLRVTTTDGD